MSRAAVLLGGGFLGEAQQAELARQEKQGVTYDYYIGESVGSIVGAATAAVGADAALDFWDVLAKPANVYGHTPGKMEILLTLIGEREGIFLLDPLRLLLRDFFTKHPIRQGKLVVPMVSDLVERQQSALPLGSWSDAATVANWVGDSCMVPLFHSVRMGRFADGGVLTDPVTPAILLGADTIDIYHIGPLDPGRGKDSYGPTGAAERAISLVRWTRLVDALLLADRVNTDLRTGSAREQERYLAIRIFWTEEKLGDWMSRTTEDRVNRRSAQWRSRPLEEWSGELRRMRQLGYENLRKKY